jgi:phosphatidylglycerophosphatase A
MRLIVRLLGSCFGLGLSPWMPGTVGTLGGVAIAWYLPSVTALWVTALGLAVLGLPLAFLAERYFGQEDPQWFVLDEVAAYLFVLIGLPFHEPWVLAAAFVAFRLFDITKPPPIKRIEALPRGMGVMADDLLAAVYAHILVKVITWFV